MLQVQAAACADAGASLISPFVGRIMDWYKKKEGREFAPHEVSLHDFLLHSCKQAGTFRLIFGLSSCDMGPVWQGWCEELVHVCRTLV